MTLLDKYQGCLIGLAVGDALGGPLEFMSREQILIKHGEVREMIGGGWLHLRPGEFTDDTEMMLCLAESLVDKKVFDREDVSRRYLEWFRTQPRDIGNITRAALSALDQGVSIDEASRNAHELSGYKSAGNATVMRAAPIGLLYQRDHKALVEACLQDALLTHYDKKAGIGSVTLCLLISEFLGGEKDKSLALRRATDFLEGGEGGLFSVLPNFEYVEEGELKSSAYVVDTLSVSLYHFLKTKSFEQCLVKVVNMGGDSDTAGAVSGAVAGAYYGLSGIPRRWSEKIKDRGFIAHMARRLYEVSGARGAGS